ncbi:MAG TPA: hypothetical protein VL728_14995 [Cyclobacteriaceae bacterium]|jgi:hypothetical protein|nr:hypothetical protein [Cyclobacteriaceae bacterium]
MQVWEKMGRIYENKSLHFTHASVPLAWLETDGSYTIFFTARNQKNQSVPYSLSFDLDRLKVLHISETPLLLPGRAGEFDSDGVMPSCLVRRNDLLYLFYIGWNRAVDVPFRNSIGLAISKDGGRIFTKAFNGPIVDRGIFDPCFVASCDVAEHGNGFIMWYLSALKWVQTDEGWKHYYHIKYAMSQDLINWTREGKIAIDFLDESEYAISTPRILKNKMGLFGMWYSYRGGTKNQTYRIGYAESENGFDWIRKDDEIGLNLSKDGWDSKMVCYPFLFESKNNLFMLYNGNDYGRTGFGLARLKT